MENLHDQAQQQQLADDFWQTHFPNEISTPVDDRYVLDSDFLSRLQTALEDADLDTVTAILTTSPAIRIVGTEVYMRIVRIAKRVWDVKKFGDPRKPKQ